MGSRNILYSHYWAHHGNDPSCMTIIQLQGSSKSRYWTAKFISDGARKKKNTRDGPRRLGVALFSAIRKLTVTFCHLLRKFRATDTDWPDERADEFQCNCGSCLRWQPHVNYADCWMRNIGNTSLQIVGGWLLKPPRAALVKFQLIKYSVTTLTCRNLRGCG